MYLDAIPLNNGPNVFVSASSGIVEMDNMGCFRVKIANAAECCISVKSGGLLGHLSNAKNSLKSSANLSEAEWALFHNQVSLLAVLVPSLDTQPEQNPFTSEVPGMALEDSESASWGPKTTEPSPDQIYSSDKLQEIIDTALSPSQRDTLHKVVEWNQTAFSFDGRIRHLLSKVHITLAPDMKPISMALYYALPAKHEVIDKQLDLWLSQGVIEESKSLWEPLYHHCDL